MFKDCGKKIKIVASVWFWMCVIGALIGAIIMMADGDEEMIGIGFGIMFGGAAFAYISALMIYGFGQLVENSDKVAEGTRSHKVKKSGTAVVAPKQTKTYEESEESGSDDGWED